MYVIKVQMSWRFPDPAWAYLFGVTVAGLECMLACLCRVRIKSVGASHNWVLVSVGDFSMEIGSLGRFLAESQSEVKVENTVTL